MKYSSYDTTLRNLEIVETPGSPYSRFIRKIDTRPPKAQIANSQFWQDRTKIQQLIANYESDVTISDQMIDKLLVPINKKYFHNELAQPAMRP
jgi:hypothetical protein